MHSTTTRRLVAGISLAALTLLGPSAAALAAGDAPSGTHRHVHSPTATSGTPAPAHTHEMGGMNMGGDMSGHQDGMDMSGDMSGHQDGMDMNSHSDAAPHGHAPAVVSAATGLDSWTHRGVLISFAALNVGALAAAAVLRRRPHATGKPRPARTLPAPTGHTA